MRDNSVPVNPVKSDEQRKTSQECRARRCCLPCGPAKSTTGVKAKTSAPPHSTPHLRGLDIPWCVTSNPPGGDAERAAADGRHTTAGLAHGRQDGGPRGLSGDSSRKALVPRPGGATGSPSVLQDEPAAQHVLAPVPAKRRSVDPPFLVSWRSAPPPAPIARAGPLPRSAWNAAEPSC